MKLFWAAALLLIGLDLGTAHAHTLTLLIENQEDGTLVVRGRFSTGQSAAGAMVQIKSLISGNMLYAKRLPAESELTVTIPSEPYTIILDGGPMHQSFAKGPPPPGGFTASLSESSHPADPKGKKTRAHRVLWALSGLMWGLAIILGYKKIRADI